MYPTFTIFGIELLVFQFFEICALLIAYRVFRKQMFMKRQQRKEMMRPLFTAIPFIVISGKIFFLIGLYSVTYQNEWQGVVYELLHSGFVFYGGLTGFVVGVLVYAKVKKVECLDILNFWVPYIALLQAIGRIGCFFNGCCYGVECTGALCIPYPIDGIYYSLVPIQLIESAFCFILSAILFHLIAPHQRGLVYFISYPVARFFFEYFRGDEIRGHIWAFSLSQWVSLIILIFVAFYATKHTQYLRRK